MADNEQNSGSETQVGGFRMKKIALVIGLIVLVIVLLIFAVPAIKGGSSEGSSGDEPSAPPADSLKSKHHKSNVKNTDKKESSLRSGKLTEVADNSLIGN